MKLLCTKRQASTKDETLDKLMRIKLFPLKLDEPAIERIIDIFNKDFNKERYVCL